MELLLHCCCAPCSVSCVKALRGGNIEPHLYWYNPNIHPYTEYVLRRDCLLSFADNEKLELSLLDEYGLRLFLYEMYEEIKTPSFLATRRETSRGKRCEKCYSTRLEKTASFAAEKGFSAFSTTLLISPYQNHDMIKQTGEEASAKHGVAFFYRDFRALFREGQAAARAKGMYKQKYCGCVFSEEERFSELFSAKKRGQRGYNSERKSVL